MQVKQNALLQLIRRDATRYEFFTWISNDSTVVNVFVRIQPVTKMAWSCPSPLDVQVHWVENQALTLIRAVTSLLHS